MGGKSFVVEEGCVGGWGGGGGGGEEPSILELHFLYTTAVSLTSTLLKLVTGLRLPLSF